MSQKTRKKKPKPDGRLLCAAIMVLKGLKVVRTVVYAFTPLAGGTAKRHP
jgi:hypothetical protein